MLQTVLVQKMYSKDIRLSKGVATFNTILYLVQWNINQRWDSVWSADDTAKVDTNMNADDVVINVIGLT